MNMKPIVIACLAFLFFSCNTWRNENTYKIIPEPQEITSTMGTITLSDTIGVIHTDVIEGFIPGGPEAYELDVNPDGILIKGNSVAGVFYARQTLDQILPPGGLTDGEMEIPCVTIRDWPAFPWRGGMLDVSRHFFPKEFILKYIDILAFHKLNHFHWHLTDGTAWRLEIDAYPELTANVDSYSKEEVREIVKYAQERFVTIIPEIEMPGHSEAALEILPELRCNPNEKSGVYCAGKEEVFEFLETVLTEVMELFPSDIIHVGGDEVGKGQWQKCPDCQARVRSEGLDNEEELQSYFIKRIAAFLKQNGRKLIGWDEIMEGGLSVDAKVMSWRGVAGGIEASQMGHDVVMSPGYPCYFDHYQSSHEDEPQAWGGLNGIKDVYGFNPIPDEIPDGKRHYVLGGQANLWTEQIATPDQAEYMMMPRYSALSEALWSGPDKSDWARFEQKMILQLHRYEALDYNYSGSAFTPDLSITLDEHDACLLATLSQELNLYPIHYSLDGQNPTTSSPVYSETIHLKAGQSLRAQTFREGQPLGFMTRLDDLPNLATGKTVSYATQWEDSYAGSKEKSLTDAQLASKRGDHPNWQGFQKKDLDVVLDLGEETEVSSAWIRFFQHAGMTRVMFPSSVEIFGSVDGNEFHFLAQQDFATDTSLEAKIKKIRISFKGEKLRFIRFKAINPKVLFPGHPRERMDAWIFTDELGVN